MHITFFVIIIAFGAIFTWMEQLEKAVLEEMLTYKEEWESKLDELEKESAYLLVYIVLNLFPEKFQNN